MSQLSLRIPEQLADALRARAASRGQSVNAYATAVLGAAVDPDLAGDEAERLRERLARAGLLEESAPRRGRPDAAVVRRARELAGSGTALSELVGEGRR